MGKQSPLVLQAKRIATKTVRGRAPYDLMSKQTVNTVITAT